MAFPTIQSADTQNNVQTSNSNSWTLTYPTNLATNDLILAFAATDGTTTGTWPADWASSRVAEGTVTLLLAKKKSNGTETGTFSLSLDASEQGAWRIFRITGWEGTHGTGWSGATEAVQHSSVAGATGSSNTPDPTSINPGAWDVEDTLWLACCAVDASRTISVYPLADNNTAGVSGGATGATLGLCTLNDAVASKDPGTFTISASDGWAALTVAVRPAASVPPPPRYGFVNFQDPGVF